MKRTITTAPTSQMMLFMRRSHVASYAGWNGEEALLWEI
jgi:hypothetical protein